MSGKSDDATDASTDNGQALEHDELAPESVVRFLGRHPEFLNDHPELFSALVPPALNRVEYVVHFVADERWPVQGDFRHKLVSICSRYRSESCAAADIIEGGGL